MNARTRDRSEPALRRAALEYHERFKPGKLEVRPTKPMANQRDLSRAYSPGVAEACKEILRSTEAARRLTTRGNLVGVVSNGSAVLGLGNIGALAAKPVMEGKAVLFKRFANIDCFDVELDEPDPYRLAKCIRALEPTFGAINLEDIKAPDCFIVERLCRETMRIPVFHDDQHGTAIVTGAAAVNAMHVAGKELSEIKLVSTGGGAAGIACLNMLVKLGLRRENIWLFDLAGLVRVGRAATMSPQQREFARRSEDIALEDAIEGADFFLGLSGPGVLTKEMVKRMAGQPIVFALANPTPEIFPEDVRDANPDAIVATGRSDYPNQVNNVLCFPFIFRGALDVGATEINDEMCIACVTAIAELARKTTSAETAAVYRGQDLRFGREYLIPKPFDPRLMKSVASAVAEAAVASAVATIPIPDMDVYRRKLDSAVFRTSMIMRPVFEAARKVARRIVFAEGEDERVLRTANAMLEEMIDVPVLIGRSEVVRQRFEAAGLPASALSQLDVLDPETYDEHADYCQTYHALTKRGGVTGDLADAVMRANATAIAAVMVRRGEADSLICGSYGQYLWHLKYVSQILSQNGLRPVAALSLLILESGPIFIADTEVNVAPSAEQIADTVRGAARHVRRFGLEPRIALCSSSQFGSMQIESARRMIDAMEIIDRSGADFAFDGEMNVDSALDPALRAKVFPGSRLSGAANVLVFPGIESAGAVRGALKQLCGGLEVGPLLVGMGNRAHIVTPAVTSRGLLNTAALAGASVQHGGHTRRKV